MFFENPYFIVILGFVATLTPMIFWFNLGETKWLIATAGCLAFFGIWLLIERTVETDRESLHRTIYEYAELVRQNKIDELMQHVDPDLNVRQQARGTLSKYEFVACGVTSLSREPEVKQAGSTVVAEIEFVGTASARVNGSGGVMTSPPIRVRLRFRKLSPGKWQVTDYDWARMGKDPVFSKDLF